MKKKFGSLQTSAFSLVTHTVALLAKTLFAHCALEWLRVFVYSEMILEVTHLFEHLFAVVDTANKELTPPYRGVVGRLNVKVLRKRVYRFNGVVCKQCYDSF